jgi:hypothetical protein
MIRFVVPLILWFFLPTLASEADNQKILPSRSHSGILKKRSESVEIPYVFSKLTLTKGPLKAVKIDHPPKVARETPFSLVATAEATGSMLTHDYLEKLCNSVNEATRLNELGTVLSQHNFQTLKEKEKQGISQYTILAAIQSLRPQDIRVLDSDVEENHATVAVRGWSQHGPTQGIIHLVKEDEFWKIESEEWQADTTHMPIYSFLAPDHSAMPDDLISQITPGCERDGNFLGLQHIPFRRENKAIAFVFLMNKPKADLKAKVLPGEEYVPEKERGRMHIMWTGSKKYPKDQQIVDGRFMDVSVARYNEGFAPGEWNLILPRKKPKEIDFTMLWAF